MLTNSIKCNFVIIDYSEELRREVSDFFADSDCMDCVMAVESVEKFLKYHRDFMEIRLVLLAVMLGNQSSIYKIPHIRQRLPNAEIIMFTSIDDTNTIFQALTYGATGYLLKGISMSDLRKSMYDVCEGGGAALNPAVAKKIIQHFVIKDKSIAVETEEEDKLGEKENIVIHLLKDGLHYQEIAQRMGLSVNGVRYYIKSIYRKLHVKSRAELVRKHFMK